MRQRSQVASGDGGDGASAALLEERNSLSEKVTELETRLKSVDSEKSQQGQELATLKDQVKKLELENKDLKEKVEVSGKCEYKRIICKSLQ